MQGKLSEIDIRSIMQLIELGQRTGELFVEAYGANSSGTYSLDTHSRTLSNQSWIVFFYNGQIIYAGDSRSNLNRLRDHLHRYRLAKVLDRVSSSAIATVNAPEYGQLWALLEKHVLTPAQGRSIIQSMVYETLFDLLSLHQGAFTFEIAPPLSPQLTAIEVSNIVTKIMKQVQEWKQFHPHLQSPDQCPVIAEEEVLRATLKENTFNTLTRWMDGKTSVRQMSRYLHRDIVTVAKAIYPYVQQGSVHALSPPAHRDTPTNKLKWQQSPKPPRIVCIDDSATVRKAVEYILRQDGYDATSIGNPLKALSLVFQIKPDLILCDIAMPELDGYEICAMLRKSSTFRQTPIVMLTGKDGFIDRVKARTVEATDYLTKPFGAHELVTIVEKYVGATLAPHPRTDSMQSPKTARTVQSSST